MKFPVYPIILVTVVAIIGSVALWREMPSLSTAGQEAAETFELDGDGDHDGDPVEIKNTEVSEEALIATPVPPPTSSPTRKPVTAPSTPTPTTPTPTPTTPASKPSGYTMAQVSAHASVRSCWTAIGSSVYDLTSWISQHPGGKSAILRLCGKNGTAAFDDQHGGQSRPERELASFRVGALI